MRKLSRIAWLYIGAVVAAAAIVLGAGPFTGLNWSQIGVLGLEFDRQWAPLIARREEYDPAKFVELIELADRAGRSLGEHKSRLADEPLIRVPMQVHQRALVKRREVANLDALRISVSNLVDPA